jgi:hypothetical protein
MVKAFEEELISDETALLYCSNKTQMSQRLDMAKRQRDTAKIRNTLKMQFEETPPVPELPPVLADEPQKTVATGGT